MEHHGLNGAIKGHVTTKCTGCIWINQCGGRVPCSDYDAGEDEYIDNYIKDRQLEYHEDWVKYLVDKN